jgi:uncharacterized iron-regulated membrane protein
MIKKGFLWAHKWLGLISGIVVMIVSMTGCIYVFHDDIKLLVYPNKYYISQTQNTDRHIQQQPLSLLIAQAEKSLGPGRNVSRVDLYPAPDRTWIFRSMETDPSSTFFWKYYRHYDRVFINPFTGEVQAIEDSKSEFFQIILQLHMNLLLGKTIGEPVVGGATIIFIILLISGLVLWWPKKWSRKSLKRSFQLDRKAKWKRINYDLHNVLGFYSLLFALILCITGLVFAYPTFKEMYVNGFNRLSTSRNDIPRPNRENRDVVIPQITESTRDNALIYTLGQHPQADMMSLRLRSTDERHHDIQVRLNRDKTSDFIWYYFDQTNGQISKLTRAEELPIGDKLASMNYDIHVGSIGGIWTKILAFTISLICASLPITGFIIWMNKRAKKKRRK